MPRARPPRPFDPKLAAHIVFRIYGGELLRDLWRDPALPGRFTLKRWRREVPEFSRAVRAAVNAARSGRYFEKSPYDHEALKAEVCARLSAGEPLRRIMQEDHMPAMWTLRRLLELDEDFQWDLAVARERALDSRGEVLLPDLFDWSVPPTRFRIDGKLDFRLMPKRYGVDLLLAERKRRRLLEGARGRAGR
ncbi:hypothetical protein [Phenylobacterium sp.]|jgi:hypothetical protein|uniref:terminase small subunit-like protein n=1 Tax=Phenylobacterium sp. TaxID=1871053 RepID=UPI002F93D350